MTGTEQHLNSMGTAALKRMLRDSRKALATAEPREQTDLRARDIATANRRMIPLVEAVLASR